MTNKQILRFATQFKKDMLKNKSDHLMCYAVSAPLAGLLTMMGVKCNIFQGGIDEVWCSHTWIELENGLILDPTASQFNESLPTERQMPNIYIGERPSWYLSECWNPK